MPGGKIKRGNIPRGIEVLVKKASIDPDFKIYLLEERAACAARIGLKLNSEEAAMLSVIPVAQLEVIICRTRVAPGHRAVFLGRVATAMLAVLGFTAVSCSGKQDGDSDFEYETTGIDPDLEYLNPDETVGDEEGEVTEEGDEVDAEENGDVYESEAFGTGIRPDLPYIDPEEGEETENQ